LHALDSERALKTLRLNLHLFRIIGHQNSDSLKNLKLTLPLQDTVAHGEVVHCPLNGQDCRGTEKQPKEPKQKVLRKSGIHKKENEDR
jgi:hypothetical protein